MNDIDEMKVKEKMDRNMKMRWRRIIIKFDEEVDGGHVHRGSRETYTRWWSLTVYWVWGGGKDWGVETHKRSV